MKEGNDARQDELELQVPRMTETLRRVKIDEQGKDRKIHLSTLLSRSNVQWS